MKANYPKPKAKPGSRSRLALLPDAQRTILHDWLTTGRKPLEEIVRLVKSEFGVHISAVSLWRYWRAFTYPGLKLPKLAPVDYTVERILLLKKNGRVIARSNVETTHFRRSERKFYRTEIRALFKVLNN